LEKYQHPNTANNHNKKLFPDKTGKKEINKIETHADLPDKCLKVSHMVDYAQH